MSSSSASSTYPAPASSSSAPAPPQAAPIPAPPPAPAPPQIAPIPDAVEQARVNLDAQRVILDYSVIIESIKRQIFGAETTFGQVWSLANTELKTNGAKIFRDHIDRLQQEVLNLLNTSPSPTIPYYDSRRYLNMCALLEFFERVLETIFNGYLEASNTDIIQYNQSLLENSRVALIGILGRLVGLDWRNVLPNGILGQNFLDHFWKYLSSLQKGIEVCLFL